MCIRICSNKEKTDMITDVKKIEEMALYQAQVLIHGQQVIGGILPGDWLKTVCQANGGTKGFEIRAVKLGVE